ncbi:MAG: acyltransferase [Acidobacteriota bacterium]|nr:acyltransferase [Acidobacteriota bacterium]
MFTNAEPSPWLLPIFAGNKAVILFFVLSGYVLSLPYWAGKRVAYRKYLIKRICRIYLPYLAALLLAVVVGGRLLYANLNLSSWFYGTWHTPFNAGLIVRQVLFASHQSQVGAINTAFWSLRYEMEMSLVFPLVCWILLRLDLRVALLLTLGLELAGMGHLRLPYEMQRTVLWGSAFIFGAIMAKERLRIIAWYDSRSTAGRYVLCGAVIAGFYYGGFGTEAINIPAACGVIMLTECCRARLWLSHSAAEYLGRISYSLYLVHGTVLFATFILLYGKIPAWTVVSIAILASFGISHLFCTWVEMPTIALGKTLTYDKQ